MLRTNCHSIRHIKNMYYFYESNERICIRNDWHFYILNFRIWKENIFLPKWSLGLMTTHSKLKTWAESLMNKIVIRTLFCIIFGYRWNGESPLLWRRIDWRSFSFESVESSQLLEQLVSLAFDKCFYPKK